MERQSPEDDPVGNSKIRLWRGLSFGMTLAFILIEKGLPFYVE